MSTRTSRPLGLAMALLAMACGGRSALLVERDDGGLGGDSDAVPDDADDGAPVDGGADADADADAGEDADPEPSCTLVPAGAPIAVPGFNPGAAMTPSIAAIDPAGAIALEAVVEGGVFRTSIEVVGLAIAPSWPDGVSVRSPALTVTDHTLTYAQMIGAAGGGPTLALAWFGGPGRRERARFRTIDVGTWTLGPVVAIAEGGSTPTALAAGSGMGPMGFGYGGLGYGIAWEERVGALGMRVQVVAGVLGESGDLVYGMHPLTGVRESAPSPTVAWSGAAYLFATAFDRCVADEPLCAESSVVVSRFRPASGDLVDDSGVDLASIIPVSAPGAVPASPSMASDGARTFLSWFERLEDGAATVRLVELGTMGEPLGPGVVVADAARPLSRVELAHTGLGLVLVWAEDGDASLPDGAPGRAHVIVRRTDEGLGPIETPPPIDATAYVAAGHHPLATLADPPRLLVTWAGAREGGGPATVYLALLDCVEGGR